MTFKTAIAATVATIALGSAAAADGHAATKGYALSGDGSRLIVMDSIAMPQDARSVALSAPIRSIAWRPVTGELIGYADGKIVTIDTQSGTVVDQGATFMENAMIAGDAVVAFDFNNKIDAVRAVSSQGDNLVYFPGDFGDDKANSVRRFTSLAYADGDISAGAEPLIFANAYTNAIDGMKAGDTFQYALDARANALVNLANNAGTLDTIGLITIDGAPADILPEGGFDIVSPQEGTDAAYAVLHIDGQDSAGLYAIDLSTGAATMLADLGMSGISSFAVSSGK
ncbi:DUF4394 domain-containing protein [Aliishimia ponticola]|uniref:DUF4394 domain-containing protein n=1 Tax=Aliishimia ponticola TaxID=2499833 RepID=A0A4S4NK15_9RHOB|nr:DUF4394 domain-containing protein [Aliishimia ponticola]THH38638.1 DUF4394 domain-containing protein [Aliishimia ponticola]